MQRLIDPRRGQKTVSDYYNTTARHGRVLEQLNLRAKSQNALVLTWFLDHHKPASPHEIKRHVFRHTRVPITSVRRAITTLERKYSMLVKTNERVPTPYPPHLEHRWELSDDAKQRDLFE